MSLMWLRHIWLKRWAFGIKEVHPNASSSLSSVKAATAQITCLTSQKFFNKNKEDQTLQPECLEGTQLPAHCPAARGHHLNALCNMLFKKPKTYRSQAEDSCGSVWWVHLLSRVKVTVLKQCLGRRFGWGATSQTLPASSQTETSAMQIIPLREGRKCLSPKSVPASSIPGGAALQQRGGTDGSWVEPQQPPSCCWRASGAGKRLDMKTAGRKDGVERLAGSCPRPCCVEHKWWVSRARGSCLGLKWGC